MAEDDYVLPPPEDSDYWERFHAVGLNQPDQTTTNGQKPGQYTWIDLTASEYAIPPAPPAIKGILYAGRRHVISGPPESTKTLIAYMLLLEALRQGEGVCILDFEMGPHAAATLLRELGATNDELATTHYTEPEGPPGQHDLERILGLGVGYCLVDAAAGAYDATGLDDNSRKDAETFAQKWIRPLWQQGVATIVIDHVVKQADQRGKFAIGSERKTGQADVHLSLETLKTLHRGSTGIVKVRVHKDRPGHLPRPTAYVVDLASDPETHQISWTFKQAEAADDEHPFRPTRLMQKVSKHLGQQDEPISKNTIFKDLGGRKEWVLTAIDILCDEGYATTTQKGISHVSHYLESEDPEVVPGGSQVVPGTTTVEVVPVVPGGSPPHGGTGTTGTPHTTAGTDEVVPSSEDPTQAMLDYDSDIPF